MTDRYALPALPYSYDALEPWCPAETLHLHHSKHHAAYVHGANESAEIIADIDPEDSYRLAGAQATFNFNLGGHILHSLFWPILSSQMTSPAGVLATRIKGDFGSQTRLHDMLIAACMGVQGSGWGALVYDTGSQTLRTMALHDHQHQLVAGTEVVAVIDVWEHAYYLTHQNDRAAWVKAVIEHLDWKVIAERFNVAAANSSLNGKD